MMEKFDIYEKTKGISGPIGHGYRSTVGARKGMERQVARSISRDEGG
jgi:hypothetical protein